VHQNLTRREVGAAKKALTLLWRGVVYFFAGTLSLFGDLISSRTVASETLVPVDPAIQRH
jgi:hypothetical protein